MVDEEGSYLIPIFTSNEQLNAAGEGSSAINQSFDELLNSLDQWPDCLGYVVNPFTNKIMIDRSIRDKIRDFTPKSHVAFVQGSVLDLHVDAVVNSAHETLLGGMQVDEILMADGAADEWRLCGGGLNGAIHEAAGPKLFDACKELGGCMKGDAKITKAYGIEYDDYIIHTVGPFFQNNETEESVLASCYTKALDLAAEHGCSSIAFPCISAGALGFPVSKAAATALISVVEWFEAHQDIVMNVYLCAYTQNEYKAYLRMIKQ